MRVVDHQRPAGGEETSGTPPACCHQESFSCLNPPSSAAHQVTVRWEDEAFERQLAKCKELVIGCGEESRELSCRGSIHGLCCLMSFRQDEQNQLNGDLRSDLPWLGHLLCPGGKEMFNTDA
ncbi:hypothetical protein VZT92_002168 [Zoarces viviparus]|uniref:Uncharacterized protein n=1 Tax=Zoarces viviparus TaxID=48416 RepID=A0AAW1FZZ8_ZOAVI